MKKNEFVELVKTIAEACGFEDKKNGIFRDRAINSPGDSAWFGFISSENEKNSESGRYTDLSLVFFPTTNTTNDMESCLISLGVGTDSFQYDLDLASLPGTRRLFLRLKEKGNTYQFFKNDFTDTTSNLVKTIKGVSIDKKYESLLQAGQFIDFNPSSSALTCHVVENANSIQSFRGWYNTTKNKSLLNQNEINKLKSIFSDELLMIIGKWVSAYATMREWRGNKREDSTISSILPSKRVEELEIIASGTQNTDSIYDILLRDKFIVLQGAPGTGKTYSALEIAKQPVFKDHVCFTQFHAETTYSDFVYGIRPKLNSTKLEYEPHQGILLKAILEAEKIKKENKDLKVLLIIDEINRANLSNVLGPVFYLFEKNRTNNSPKIFLGIDEYGNNIEIDSLPDNLFVIATMNTADRSLAVVDFALRRRFTWLTLKPQKIAKKNLPNHLVFCEDEYDVFEGMFEKYATDEELNLQPGQSYFIVDASDQDKLMKSRLKYELLPLIKEYLNEDHLQKAKDAFTKYFMNSIDVLMYE